MIQYRAWQLVSFLAGKLPLRVSYSVATAAGWVGYWCWPRGRRNVQRNFRRVVGGDRRTANALGRHSLANYCKYLVDFARFPSQPAATLISQAHGDQAFADLDMALAEGKGALIVCMHFGNWDLGAGATAARGYPVNVVVESFGDGRLDRLVAGARERLGMNLLRMEKPGPSLYRVLKANGLLALLIDRPLPGEGVPATFFGSEVSVPAGPARLALKTGARLVAAAFPRIDPWQPDVALLTDFSIRYEPTGDDRLDVQALTQLLMASHERIIRKHPDQWYMFRDMWAGQAT